MSESLYDPFSPSRSHRRFRLAIVVLLILVVGLASIVALLELPTIFRTPTPPGDTYLHGSVTAGSETPVVIGFVNATNGISSYPMKNILQTKPSYTVVLQSNVSYRVFIGLEGSSSVSHPANPRTIVPEGSDETQDFACC